MNIALTLLSHEEENGNLQNIHMPLSIGVLAEFLNLKFTKTSLDINLFKRPSKFDKYYQNQSPDVVLMGNYMWNENLNLFYAALVKKHFPNCLIVIGGPNISTNIQGKGIFLKQNTCIDILVEGDGEIVCLEILNSFYDNNLNIKTLKKEKISNCYSLNHKTSDFYISEGQDTRLGIAGKMSLDEIPSPYLSGFMDEFFEHGAVPLLESNRGCPYACTYCQQGTKYFSKVRFFEGARIKDELIYISKLVKKRNLKMNIVEFADPNFGQYKQDLKVFQGIRQVQDMFYYPSQVWCSTGKSQAPRILEYAKILKPNSIMIRAAMQSMNVETLKSIERKNLPSEVFESFSDEGVETYSDIMLGLPLETLRSYISGILKLVDSKIDEFSMPQTLVLKGTPMESVDYIKKYEIKTKVRVIPECIGFYGPDKVHVMEFENVITENSTLSSSDYLECRKFVLIVMIFHNARLLSTVYRYLDYKGIPRSNLLRAIFDCALLSLSFRPLINKFIDLTREELLEFEELPKNSDIDNLTSNKIYKFLSIALMHYKLSLIEIFSTALLKIGLNFEEKEFFSDILNDVLLTDLMTDRTRISKPIPKFAIGAFKSKSTYECFLTDFQIKKITHLAQLYPKKADQENKLPYHLRPANITKTIRFV